MAIKREDSAGCCSSSIMAFTATAANDDEDINNEWPQQQSPLTSTTTTSSASESCIPSSISKASLWNLPSMELSLTQRNKIRTSNNNHNQSKTRKRPSFSCISNSAISCGLLLLSLLLLLLGTTSLVSAQPQPPPQERLLRSQIEAQVQQQLQSQLTPQFFQTIELQEQRQLQPSQIPRTFSISESRQVKKYALPAFSMVLRLRLSEDDYQYNDGDDDNFLQIYLDLEILQETIERVTQLHLTDMFQQFAGSYVDFHSERFIGVALTTKVRQLDLAGGTDDDDGAAIEFDNDDDTSDASVPLHAAFSGLVTFSFPSDAVPPSGRVDEAIEHVLKTSLTAENYLLLFRRFLSTGALENLQDLEDIRIGDKLVSVITTSNGNAASGSSNGKEDAPTNVNVHSGSSSKKKGMNAVTIAAIAIFLTFSCLLMLFGATVVLLMQDRAKQEERFQERAIANMNNSDHSNGSGETDKSAGDDGEDDGQNKTDNNSSDDDSSTEATPAWKRAVLPVLRKAIMVRRYWRRYLRKQRRYQKHSDPKNQGPEQSLPPSDEENVNNFSPAFEEEDDGLNDEDVYFDEGLSDEEAANQWLDSWSASLTSIPLRQPYGNNNNRRSARSKSSSPGKRKKKSKSSSPLAPHPAKRQSRKTFLGCIAEEDSVIEASNSQEVPSPHNNGSNTISASTDSSLLMVAPSDELERDAATFKVQAQSMLCGSIPEDEEEFGSPPRDFETDAKVRAYDGASVRRKTTSKSDQEFVLANGRSSSSFDDEKKELEKMEELLERSGSSSRLNTSTGSFDMEDTQDIDPTHMEDVEDVDLS